MKTIAMLAAVAAITATLPQSGGRQAGQSVTICDDGGAYVIVDKVEDCQGAAASGVITVVGEDMVSIDMDGKNVIINTPGQGS